MPAHLERWIACTYLVQKGSETGGPSQSTRDSVDFSGCSEQCSTFLELGTNEIVHLDKKVLTIDINLALYYIIL
jgi:hypothetical protein